MKIETDLTAAERRMSDEIRRAGTDPETAGRLSTRRRNLLNQIGMVEFEVDQIDLEYLRPVHDEAEARAADALERIDEALEDLRDIAQRESERVVDPGPNPEDALASYALAYVLGNPEVYDPVLAADPEGLRKAPGTVVFARFDDAVAALLPDGNLPEEWGLSHLPGAVYSVALPPGSIDEDPEVPVEVPGGWRLASPARILGRVALGSDLARSLAELREIVAEERSDDG